MDGPCVAEVGFGEGEGVPVAGRGAADGDDGGARGDVAGLRRHQVHLALSDATLKSVCESRG